MPVTAKKDANRIILFRIPVLIVAPPMISLRLTVWVSGFDASG
jgi:hypothetical protein